MYKWLIFVAKKMVCQNDVAELGQTCDETGVSVISLT